jgi:hypothetical protein
VTNLTGDTDHPELPVIGGEGWFDANGKPFVLRVEYPLTFDEMVAAIYGTADPADLVSDEDLCGTVAVTLSLEGLPGLSARVSKLRHAEGDSSIQSAVFLATCRQRVAALLAHGHAKRIEEDMVAQGREYA